MTRQKLALALVIAACALTLTACPEKKKGPVQKAGETIDEAAEKVGDAINPKGPAEKAGREVDKALED